MSNATIPEIKSDHYVYIYHDPRKNNQEFYVGISKTKTRWKDHLKEAKKFIEQNKSQKWIQENCTNPHKIRTIMKILRADLEPKIAKVMEGVTEEQAKDEEIRLIAYYGRADKGLGPLTNMTDVGDGRVGAKIIDLTGQKFHRLKVIEYAETDNYGSSKWICRCDCGNEKIFIGSQLKCGNTKSCGCLNKEIITKHGKSRTTEYNSWNTIYQKYIKKEIKICSRWLKFSNFLEDMGKKPSAKHVLGRIHTDGNFELSNCKWISREESLKHRKNGSHNRYIIIDGESKILEEWSRISGTHRTTILGRLRRNWSPKEAIFGKKKGLAINGEIKTIKEWSTISETNYSTILYRIRNGWSPKEAVYGKH